MARGTIRLIRGDDHSETRAFDQDDGSDYDLTDAAVWFTLKANPGDADDDAILQHVSGDGSLTITDPLTGAVSHVISAAETAVLVLGVYRYDYQLVAADGTVATLERGRAEVTGDVTLSIA
jgi:hypothetical protein